jgi:hypothetical protein
MAHRIEVELTSRTSDATWTWRAAGARQPKGTVDATLVPSDARVGTVLRAEVETTLDGTTVTALLPLKTKSDGRVAERIEVLGSPARGPDVNVVLAPSSRRRREGAADGRGEGRGEGRRPRREGPARSASERPRRKDTDAARDGARDAAGDGTRERRRTGPSRPDTREAPARGRARRPAPSTTYRNAALATLKPEQLPVAEQLLRGGIPAVRQALEEQNARARAEGRPEVTPGPLLALAEELRPLVNLAAWKDRASVARNAGKDVPLRELRSIVASSSTVTLDEEGTELATALRSALDERVTALRTRWIERIATSLDTGRVADALHTSVKPPEPAARIPAELAVRLADAAGAAMNAEAPVEEWVALLEVVVDTPVRRSVKPAGIPAGADETVLALARKASGYVPELARLLGIPIPPPPGPRRPVPARSGQGRRAS